MDRLTRSRIRWILILVAVVVCVFCFRLLKLNFDADPVQAAVDTREALTYRTTLQATRGSITDRRGRVLVANRASYNIDIVNFVFLRDGKGNENLLRLMELLDERGLPVTDHLPVSTERPYAYTLDDTSETWKGLFSTFLSWKKWDAEMSAKNLILRMREIYGIPESWDDLTARRIIGMRYELDLRYCAGLDNYTVAADVPTEVLASVLELGIPGVVVNPTSIREYNTKYAAHILGRVGMMDPEEWETYKDQGYSMDARVGKDGVEQAFESYLHGAAGEEFTTVDADGSVIDAYRTAEPHAGSNVTLTIDIDLQAAAEDGLKETILDLRRNGLGKNHEGKDAEGGAVVAFQCKTGEVLACANYPTFDLSTFSEDFNRLSEDKYKPIWNRALLAPYNPGSIYKMVTAIAAIDENGLGRYREITDEGVYRYYEDQGYTCNCHVYTSAGVTHGTINLMEAISESCNYYFYEIGRETGIQAIDKVAQGLGLGEDTGVELYDMIGTRANPTTKWNLYRGTNAADWYGADTLQAAIGQSDNLLTPMQMADYAATLANGGVRYDATFLKRVTSWDDTALEYVHTPSVRSSYPISDEAMTACLEGMEMSATVGTAAAYLKDYPIPVAAKTGTAQHGSGGSDNASFLCFAPADDPEIAIVIYVEKGAQGGNLGKIAREMLDVYFASGAALPTLPAENTVN